MGNIADDMIGGKQCSWCGTYFEEEHGHPVVCEFCSENEDHDPETDPPIATNKEL